MKKQNAPQPPDTAPRDGSVILADFGWHYYLPTAVCSSPKKKI